MGLNIASGRAMSYVGYSKTNRMADCASPFLHCGRTGADTGCASMCSNLVARHGRLTAPICTPTPAPEQALLNLLTYYFAGTSVGYEYGVSTASNGSDTVANAPINYLQI